MKRWPFVLALLAVAVGILGIAPARNAAAIADYDTAFLTDQELEDKDSMSLQCIRDFLRDEGGYFKDVVPDVDGQPLDVAQAVYNSAQSYRISPKVILATLEKENDVVTRKNRPKNWKLRALTGCSWGDTARDQISCTGERFRAYHDQLTNTGQTVSGWKVGVAKQTQDGVWVTPATKAVAGQFTYTPHAGRQWGGDDPRWGGVYRFYNAWYNKFHFDSMVCPGRVLDLAFVIDVTGSMADDIAAVKASATDIVNLVATEFPDSRIGLATYRDFPVLPYGGPGDFPYRENLIFTSDESAAIGAIQGLSVCCGADWRESVYSAVIGAMQNSALGGWRAGAGKVIIQVGDAPPHDPEPFTGYTLANVQAAYDAWDPVMYSVAVGGDPTTVAAFTDLTAITGGDVFIAPTADDVVDAIIEAIGAIGTAIPVEIDIKPGSDTNPINPGSHGVIPVGVITTSTAAGEGADFDATTVDPSTVVFGPGGAAATHSAIEDVDSDGDMDLVMHFDTAATGLSELDVEACLSGETYDGQPIEGCDVIVTVPPGS